MKKILLKFLRKSIKINRLLNIIKKSLIIFKNIKKASLKYSIIFLPKIIQGVAFIEKNKDIYLSKKSFFDNKFNLNISKELQKNLEVKDTVTKDKNGLLNEKTFMITGKLNGISRAEVKSLIEENSGSSVSTVSKKLNYLIIGDKPTKKKVDKARELKITILNQSQFLKILNITS